MLMAGPRPMTGDESLMTGIDLVEAKRYEEALPWLEAAVVACRREMDGKGVYAAWFNSAVAMGELGHATAALHVLNELIAINPTDARARLNRATLRMQTRDFEGAIGDYNQVALFGGDLILARAAKFGRGFANLVLGRLKEGFKDFEYRKKMNIPPPAQPEWDGKSSLSGKSILVIGEMGFGDNIMFLRYAPLLKSIHGAENVHVAVPPAMVPLAQCATGDIKVVAEETPPFDVWARMMSLAHLFGTDIGTVPPPVDLALPGDQVARWRSGTADEPGLKVGLCWSGSRESQYDRFRNVPLELLSPLFDLPGVAFYGLQCDVRESDKVAFDRLDVIDIGSRLQNFRDTACAVAALDLVITVDTSVAHLAGTIGVPTWVMLTSFRTYWLWIEGREDCPWYPSARAFRQPSDGDWMSVVGRVREALVARLASQ